MKGISLTRGWKTYAGAGLLIAVGFYLLFTGHEIEGMQAIGMGLGLLGIRHYLQYSQE